MYDIEVIAAVSNFVERGGDVLFGIALLTGVMWTLIVERVVYFRTAHKAAVERVQKLWADRVDHSSWQAHQIRAMLVSEVKLDLERGLSFVKTAVALCPMFGLLGTVTGMIEVFDVMASTGSGNARGMAAGVSKATLPTMAGMVAALSGMLFSIQLERFARDEAARVADSLEVVHE
jgi:biopolymer transport protein ExbB